MVRFGRFEFDAAARRVRSGEEDIRLPPKAFDLLSALIDGAPGVVTKRELHARLWAGGLVADATLVALVKQLRAALGDRDRAAPLVRTVHRVGYALDVPVMRAEVTAAPTRICWLTFGQRRLPLVAGENLIGREEGAGIRLDDAAVSRRHARIVVGATGARIEDLGSKNGTTVEGVAVTTLPLVLRHGMHIAFGNVRAVYTETGASAPTLTHVGRIEP